MVLVKILGFVDLLAALSLFLLTYSVGHSFAHILFWILLIKSIIFFSTKVSLVDLAAAVFLLLGSYGFQHWVLWVFIIWLVQKGLISMFS